MLWLKVDGSFVEYDSLEAVKAAAKKSGRGLLFWREPLSEYSDCWSSLLYSLEELGAEEEIRRLNRAFPPDAPHHWLLTAAVLCADDEAYYDDPKEVVLAQWDTLDYRQLLTVVGSDAFVVWLRRVSFRKYVQLTRLFGCNSSKWPRDILLRALESNIDAEFAELQAFLKERQELLEEKRNLLGKLRRPASGESRFFFSVPGLGGVEMMWCPTATGGFWISRYEVSQAEWVAVMGIDPDQYPYWEDFCWPVEHASQEDRQEFVRRLNDLISVHAALPTEAQLDHARHLCRDRSCKYSAETLRLTNRTGFRIVIPVDADERASEEMAVRRRLYELHEARKRMTAGILSAVRTKCQAVCET